MEPTWTFKRGLERLALRRSEAPHGVSLTLAGAGRPRTYLFPTLGALVKFQRDMEQFLVNTGWSFFSFSPECRAGSDRRGFPRVSSDRRRWWTDGIVVPRSQQSGRSVGVAERSPAGVIRTDLTG